MKKHINLILCLFLLTVSCGENNRVNGQDETLQPLNKQIPHNNYFEFLSDIQLPEKLSFCGEEAPLEIPEVRERAERELYLLLQYPGQIILYLKRAGRYFPMFERIIKENNMPDDLKYLAVAESALYMARSSKNALGLWQFMKGTGRMMGLIINNYVDERCHPERSTYAAMKYLKQGYQNNGSWTLAAAGYNMGHTRVGQRLSHQSGDDYFDLFLNEETSRFVFRILIIKEIMQNSDKYGIKLSGEQTYKPYNADVIKIDYGIRDLADWAKERGYTYKELRLMNPWIINRRIPSPPRGKYYEMKVPRKD